MRRKDQEIRETLLDCARRIECAEGVDAISIRRLATEANIAIGTVYNYYENKQDVLLSLTEEYWKNVLVELRHRVTAERFSDQIAETILFLRSKMNDCAAILMKSLRAYAEPGKVKMASMQDVLGMALSERLRTDEAIRPDVWSDTFTRDAFAGFVLQNLIYLLQQKDSDEKPLLEVIKRILY